MWWSGVFPRGALSLPELFIVDEFELGAGVAEGAVGEGSVGFEFEEREFPSGKSLGTSGKRREKSVKLLLD